MARRLALYFDSDATRCRHAARTLGVLRFLDTISGQSAELLSTGWTGQTNNRQFRVSRDNRQIVFLRSENEADIWLMSPE